MPSTTHPQTQAELVRSPVIVNNIESQEELRGVQFGSHTTRNSMFERLGTRLREVSQTWLRRKLRLELVSCPDAHALPTSEPPPPTPSLFARRARVSGYETRLELKRRVEGPHSVSGEVDLPELPTAVQVADGVDGVATQHQSLESAARAQSLDHSYSRGMNYRCPL